jgi:hypothetical protein
MIKTNTNKKATIKLKDGRTFKATIVGNAGRQQIAITSKEYGDMIVDARCVKN